MKLFTVRLLVLFAAFRAAIAAPPAASCQSIDLDQNWTQEQSEKFWFTSQGSRMMPYAWFLALEVADPSSQTLFRDRSNMDRYGYIWAPPSPKNPDGLPIGFVKDPDAQGGDHIGFTCAACHTASLNIAGKLVIVEGGPALSDFWAFVTDVTKALEVATATPAKFDRFIARVEPGTNSSSPAASQLRDRMQAKLVDLQTRLNQNMPGTPFGFGRVDAFGHIFTHVLAQDLKIPANAAPPYAPAVKAPVSYPFLWDTPQHNVVQWNGSAPNTKFLKLGPLGRNVGEVLGVFGELQVVPGSKIPLLPFFTKPPQFISSARIDNLNALEGQVKQLWSPVWPKRCLPLADTATLTRGRKVYDDYCVKCHTLLTNPERKNEKREITAVLKPLPEISTDPTMAMNFVARTARTGPLEGFPDVIKLREFGPEATGDEILFAVANSVILHGIVNRPGEIINVAGFLVDLRSEFAKLREALDAARVPRYKARPLNGIWATAPYLHNGSVPTLWDLLSPPKDRPAAFYVGSRVFDPRKVGLVSTEAPGMFRYDTSPKGNWRNGHEFGTALPANQKKDLLEFLKTL